MLYNGADIFVNLTLTLKIHFLPLIFPLFSGTTNHHHFQTFLHLLTEPFPLHRGQVRQLCAGTAHGWNVSVHPDPPPLWTERPFPRVGAAAGPVPPLPPPKEPGGRAALQEETPAETAGTQATGAP